MRGTSLDRMSAESLGHDAAVVKPFEPPGKVGQKNSS
jgi:hypothetical protein